MVLFGLGWPELLIILVVILVIFGPKNLPKLGKSLGSTVKSIREGLEDGDDGDKAKDADKADEDSKASVEDDDYDEDIIEDEDDADIDEDAIVDAGVFCNTCGTKNPAGSGFCSKCGAKLA